MASLSRKDNWVRDFDAYIQECFAKPFAYGTFDCCLFVAGVIESLTGLNVANAWTSQYTSRAEGLQLLTTQGYPSLETFVSVKATELGLVEQPLKFASQGDVMLYSNEQGTLVLGVVLGNQVVSPGTVGLIGTNIATVWQDTSARSWKVG